MVTLLSADWEIVTSRADPPPSKVVEAAAANEAILAWISDDGARLNVDRTGGGRSGEISFKTGLISADGGFFVSSSTRSEEGSRCLKRARESVWFNSVCNWFLMVPSNDFPTPPGDTLCLFGGKKSNFVGSGRNSWYVPIDTRTAGLVPSGLLRIVVGVVPSFSSCPDSSIFRGFSERS